MKEDIYTLDELIEKCLKCKAGEDVTFNYPKVILSFALELKKINEKLDEKKVT